MEHEEENLSPSANQTKSALPNPENINEILTLEKEIPKLNRLAMKNLYAQNMDKAKAFLAKAHAILSKVKGFESATDKAKFGTLLSLTLNNQACLYKRLSAELFRRRKPNKKC